MPFVGVAMSIKVFVTRDFEHMSDVASDLVKDQIKTVLARKDRFVFGLATGNTPTGLYKRLVAAANGGEFDSSRIQSFNLDEYIGLPGETAQDRCLHPESYGYFMIREFFGKLKTPFASTSVPGGPLVDQNKLTAALKKCSKQWHEEGDDAGRSIVIHTDATNETLKFVRNDVLNAYTRRIAAAGGIDLQILGVGGRGHVAFHESGIPFANSKMLLVRLDENTRQNAVTDGHFAKIEDCPLYAVTMGAQSAYAAKTVVLMANGARKIEPVTESLLGPVSPDVPISYGQQYAAKGGNLIYILDTIAAQKLLENKEALAKKGVEITVV